MTSRTNLAVIGRLGTRDKQTEISAVLVSDAYFCPWQEIKMYPIVNEGATRGGYALSTVFTKTPSMNVVGPVLIFTWQWSGC